MGMIDGKDTYAAMFLNYLERERRVPLETLRGYGDDVDYFKAFLDRQLVEYSWASVDTEIIRAWVVSMAGKGNKPSVIRRRIAGIRAFFRFLQRIGKVAVNPALRLPLPKVPKRLPRFISVEGMEKLGSGHLFPSDFSGHRDRLILELLYGTGIRRAEVANLKESDIQWDRKEINVLGKGGKSRVIPVVSSLYSLLTRYREERNALFENGAVTFFVTDKGRNIYTRFVYAVSVRYLGMVTSIENKGPHLLRHTFATHLMSNGADIQAVKALLGHSSLAATQVYMHNSADRLKKIYNQAHPRAQRKNPDNKG